MRIAQTIGCRRLTAAIALAIAVPFCAASPALGSSHAPAPSPARSERVPGNTAEELWNARKAEADRTRDGATDIKADLLVKPEFDAALELYLRALDAREAGMLSKSTRLLGAAARAFDAACRHAKAKLNWPSQTRRRWPR